MRWRQSGESQLLQRPMRRQEALVVFHLEKNATDSIRVVFPQTQKTSGAAPFSYTCGPHIYRWVNFAHFAADEPGDQLNSMLYVRQLGLHVATSLVDATASLIDLL
jgi:hypothetical protein